MFLAALKDTGTISFYICKEMNSSTNHMILEHKEILVPISTWGGVPTSGNSPVTICLLYNSTQFWHYLSRDSIKFRRLRGQSYKIAPLYICCKLKVSTIPFLDFICQSEVQVVTCTDELAIIQRFPPFPPWVQLIC